jgi:predicted membrane-bound spermidine synthase
MSEKYQYGQRLSLQVKEVLNSVHTKHSHVEYLETFNHGNVLIMDNEIQLSTQDEYRYHETLVHPVMKSLSSFIDCPLNVLILGGGDGCAAREVYKWNNVSSVTIVDYDEHFVSEFGRGHLSALNKHVYSRDSLSYVPEDVRSFLRTTSKKYDYVIIDLPDPDSPELFCLYTECILLVKNVLRDPGGISIHVGPALLNPNHENWDMISNFRDLLLHTFDRRSPSVALNTCYVPSFSNEWAFLNMVTNPDFLEADLSDEYHHVADKCRYWNPGCDYVLSSDIREIYRRRL